MPLISGNRAAFSPGAGQYDGVADLLWDDVKCFFDPDLMGSLPDVSVRDASGHNWQEVLDLVVERGWKCQYSEGERGCFPCLGRRLCCLDGRMLSARTCVSG